MTVSVRVMSAGDGYKYLFRTIAAADADRSLSTPLTRYYTRKEPGPDRGSVPACSASSATTAWRGQTPLPRAVFCRAAVRPCSGLVHPAGREAHEPFHELRCRAWAFLPVQERGSGGYSSGDVLPSGDGLGVSPPAVKMSSTRANKVSDSFHLVGEPCGPCRAKSITWWLRAIVPRRACTCSRVSPPREESEARGVRNSVLAVGGTGDAVRRPVTPVGRSTLHFS